MSIILHQVSKMDTFTFIVNGLPFRLSIVIVNRHPRRRRHHLIYLIFFFHRYGIILILEIDMRLHYSFYFYYS